MKARWGWLVLWVLALVLGGCQGKGEGELGRAGSGAKPEAAPQGAASAPEAAQAEAPAEPTLAEADGAEAPAGVPAPVDPAAESAAVVGEATAAPLGCADFHWVEVHGGQPYVHLQVTAEEATALLAVEGSAARVLTPDWSVWEAPQAPPVAGYAQGEPFWLYGNESSAPLAQCTLGEFRRLTRGTPHFGWRQHLEEEGKTPEAPGCGEAALFATLVCPALEAAPSFALREELGVRAHVALGGLGELAGLDLLRAHPNYVEARAEAAAAAQLQGEDLAEVVAVQLFAGADQRLGVVTLTLQTGEGETACGGEDVRVALVALVALEADRDAVAQVLAPLHQGAWEEVVGLVVDGVGRYHLLVEIFPNTRALVALGEVESCQVSFAYCDCGC